MRYLVSSLIVVTTILGTACTAHGQAQNIDNTNCAVTGSPTWGASDGPATLLTSCFNTAIANTPAPGSIINVAANNATDLQNKLTAAACGQQITLPAGSSYSGHFTLPAITCTDNNYLWIVSSGFSSLPPEATRYSTVFNGRTVFAPQFGPCYSGVTSLPGRPALFCPPIPGTYTAQIITNNTAAAFTFTAGTSRVRIIGIEFTRPTGTGYTTDIINLAVGNVDHVVFDRIWCHGTEQGDDTNRCMRNDAVSFFAVIDSYINDIMCVNACTDSKTIGGGTNNINFVTENVHKIVNNYLEAAGENILYGGGGTNTTPQNLEIRLNLMHKPLIWNQDDPSYNGGFGTPPKPPVVKNLFELKNAQLVLVEGNQFINNWAGFTQKGQGFTNTPVNQSGNSPTAFVANVTQRYNTLTNINSFGELSIVSNSGFIAAGGHHWSIHDNVADAIGACGTNPHCPSSASLVQHISSSAIVTLGQAIHDTKIDHNTMVYASNATTRSALGVSGPTIASGFNMANITFTNNLMQTGAGILNSEGGNNSLNCANTGSEDQLVTQCWSPFTFKNNCFIANGTHTWPGSGNVTTVASYSAVFANYNGGNNGNYTVAAGSACQNAATDGLDIGANIALVRSTIATGTGALLSGAFTAYGTWN